MSEGALFSLGRHHRARIKKEGKSNAKLIERLLNEQLRLSIPEGDYDTLSGFLLTEFGSIPNVGDKISHRNYTLTVTKASSRLIEETKLIIKNKGKRLDTASFPDNILSIRHAKKSKSREEDI